MVGHEHKYNGGPCNCMPNIFLYGHLSYKMQISGGRKMKKKQIEEKRSGC